MSVGLFFSDREGLPLLDVCDGRYRTKAFNKNHPFLSELAWGKFAAASIRAAFVPLLYLAPPPSHLSIFSPFFVLE